MFHKTMESVVNVIISSIFASGVSCLIIFIGFLVNMLPGHTEIIGPIVGGALLYYLVAATAVFLFLILLSPMYILIKWAGLANYYSLFAIGFFVVMVVYKFNMPAREIYFAFAGGVAYVLFHFFHTKLLERQ